MSDISTTSWSEVDASNSQIAPEGWPAGMFPNAVEPSARMNMGALKRFWNRVNPVYLATLTTTDSYAVTEAQALAGYSLFEKRATRFPSANTTSSPTVNHSALGAMLIKKWNNAGALANLGVGDIQAQEHEMYWDGSQMVLLNPASVALGLTNKAVPTTSDSMVIADAAAGNAQKLALLGTIPSLFPSKASPTSSDSIIIADATAAGAGKQALISAVVAAAQPTLNKITNSLSGDVLLNNTATYFDGPSVAQGTVGTWFVSGTVTCQDLTNAATFVVRLWDGTTVIASAEMSLGGVTSAADTISLSGFISAPAGNLRISVKESNQTTGKMVFNATGDSKDCTISAIRIA